MSETIKPEHERVKEESNYLRGKIAEELAQDTTHFSHQTTQLLKFHGAYQQDDRDVRNPRRKEGKEPLYSLMVRSKVPGGRLNADQYLIHDELADRYGNRSLRITTRQGFQFHSVLKHNLKSVIRSINDKLGTTLGACGDNVRNVVTCPAPCENRIKARVYEYAKRISDQFLSKSGAYHEIWLNGEKLKAEAESVARDPEPIYGKTYLPRKFKISIAFPEDNCVDVYTNDIGIVPEITDGALSGFNLLVGGGMGMSHGAKDTFPRLADPLCFVSPEEIVDLTKTIVLVQRDFGDRVSRKHARMKYLIHDRGLKWFQEEVEKRFGQNLAPAHPIHWKGFQDHLGWNRQNDELWFLGISIENGRIKDDGSLRLKTGLRTAIERFKTPVYLTPTQDLLISGIRDAEKKELEMILTSHGIRLPEQLSQIQKNSMSCPALPTCGLAITESERSLPKLVDELATILNQLGLGEERITLRMTGCPNGCARPYTCEIGLVGRAVGTYNIYLGGNQDGTRLNQEYAANIPEQSIIKTLFPVLKLYQASRNPNEPFGDFCHRIGLARIKELSQPVS